MKKIVSISDILTLMVNTFDIFQCRWFAGVAKGNAKVQREIIVKCVDGALQRNATRAKAGKAPMTYDEVVEEFKRVLNVVMQIHVDKDLYTGDGYGPGCKGNCGKEAVEAGASADGKVGEKKKGEKKPSEYKKTADEQFRKKERLTCKVICITLNIAHMYLKLNHYRTGIWASVGTAQAASINTNAASALPRPRYVGRSIRRRSAPRTPTG